MIKQVLTVAAVLALSGCGGKTMIESDMSRMVEASPASPWLTVEGKTGSVVTVTGLDEKAKVQVSPDIASVVQARVRTSLQPRYFTDLIINCRDLEVQVSAKADDDAVPPAANLDLAVTCRIVARGPVVSKTYRFRESAPFNPAAPRFDVLVPKLIEASSKKLAETIWADVPTPVAKR
ncbi:hypothetical protein [Luteibacter yeojuensis]|uniref:Lipoprotein n=1 Tax=Luteibacter yeojuensis TaxID=345309 RepID=A0A7X5QS80_9GAMM|nr:hypothetical protein [Luteibacter yeojuensis]NID14473.1 hypothetical protein [Luteibacter yeojuensis]